MADLTPEQFEAKLNQKLRSLDMVKQVVFPVATATFDKYRQRLFQKGIKGDGSKTGNYSTEPTYASEKAFKNKSGFKQRGKKATGKLKNGKERRSMYLPGGYKELRAVQGMETAIVNLQYTGDLFTDFSKLSIEGNTVTGKVSRAINMDKIDGLTARFGQSTFKHTKQEREFFAQEVKNRLVKYLNS